MRVDVSEIKTYRECKRKHQLSSRNRFKLFTTVPAEALQFGTWFHECLHKMYTGQRIEDILLWIDTTVQDPDQHKTLVKMITGYYEEVYEQKDSDLIVVDIEHSFSIVPDIHEYDINVCGSIDMIGIEVDPITKIGKLVGFEHKSGKNFRPAVYNIVDEQPRLYYYILKLYFEENAERLLKKYLGQIVGLELGCIYINEVKKLKTKFEYRRTPFKYSDQDINNFMRMFMSDAVHIKYDIHDTLPTPSFMKCQMCDYAPICEHFGYEDLTVDKVLQEFEGEYYVKEKDHLDEKDEQYGDKGAN